MGIDEMIAASNPDYRFYKCDSSIKGRHYLMLSLTGRAKEDWFSLGEVFDISGKDIRPELYISAVGSTFEEALANAIERIK